MATKKTENAAEKQLKVTLVKSTIGSLDKHKKPFRLWDSRKSVRAWWCAITPLCAE